MRRDQPSPGCEGVVLPTSLEFVAFHGSAEPLERGAGTDPPARSFGRVAVVLRRSPAQQPGTRVAEPALEIVTTALATAATDLDGRPKRGHIEPHDRSSPLPKVPATPSGQLGCRPGTRSNAGFPKGNLQVCLKRKRALTRSLEPGRSGDPIRRSGSATTTAKHPRCRVASGAQPAGGPRPTRGCRRALPRPPPWAAGGLRRAAGTRTGPDQAVIARECPGGWHRSRPVHGLVVDSDVQHGEQPGGVRAELSRHRRVHFGGPAPGGSEHGLRGVHAWSKVGDRRKARHPIGVPATRSANADDPIKGRNQGVRVSSRGGSRARPCSRDVEPAVWSVRCILDWPDRSSSTSWSAGHQMSR